MIPELTFPYLFGNAHLNTGVEVVALVTVAWVCWDVQLIHLSQSKFLVFHCSRIKFAQKSWRSKGILTDDKISRVMEIYLYVCIIWG